MSKKKASKSSEKNTFVGLEIPAVGHAPEQGLLPGDAELFRGYQSNLLSLISHELRTPLTSVINAFNVVFDQDLVAQDSEARELLSIGRRSALRLQYMLSSILELAEIESKTFHVRLRELDLERTVRLGWAQWVSQYQDRGVSLIHREVPDATQVRVPILADPQKISRLMELLFEVIGTKLSRNKTLQVDVTSHRLVLSFELEAEGIKHWKHDWTQGQIAFQSGVTSPNSVFGGVVQSERAFLTRTQEGLGSEWVLIHQIMRLHQGKANYQEVTEGHFQVLLEFPELRDEEGLRAVLSSRIHSSSMGVGSIVLGYLRFQQDHESKSLIHLIRNHLQRSSDTAYFLSHKNLIALILEDCRLENAPQVFERLEKSLGLAFQFGCAGAPEETNEPEVLMRLALSRLDNK